MSIDLRFIVADWGNIGLAIIGVMLVKALVTGLLLRLNGARKGVAAEAGLIMASPSETTLIVLATAASARLISLETEAFWQVVTAIGLTLTPLLAQIGRLTARRIELRADVGQAALGVEEKAPGVIIIGFGRVGHMVAEMLATHGRNYVAVDSSIDTVTACRRKGFPVIFGDVSRHGLIDKLDLDHADALVLTMDDPVLTVRMTKKIHALHPGLTIIARARDARHAAELYRAGATDAVPETLEASLQLSEAVLIDLGIAMGPVIASIHEKRAGLRKEIMEMGEMEKEPPIRRRRLRDTLKSR
jgi:CPA2 family monovalent cation:H+ antiporter-2